MAVLPGRVGMVARYDLDLVMRSVGWLVRSREHTNLTYDLTPVNREHLAWLVAEVTGRSIDCIRAYVEEVRQDRDLSRHIAETTRLSRRRHLADPVPRYGLRIGWYALVRALEPEHVVETGTDKGLGACVVAAALLRNGHGRLTSVDTNPDAGYLIDGAYGSVVDRQIADSLDLLPRLTAPIDLFLHEVHRSAAQERAEYQAIHPLLTGRAVLVSDNVKENDELARWAERNGRRFLYFHELPMNHWYPGAGMGIAFASPRVPPDGGP
jgi:predicted O-methyltransferase YrrM